MRDANDWHVEQFFLKTMPGLFFIIERFLYRMTRNEAINLIANHSAMPRYQIALEVDRYITWPGQACAYKMGEIEFIKWKNEAKTQLGRPESFLMYSSNLYYSVPYNFVF